MIRGEQLIHKKSELIQVEGMEKKNVWCTEEGHVNLGNNKSMNLDIIDYWKRIHIVDPD